MKITLYTITDCPFSKQEKEYLTSHTLTFEEKNLESNKEFLTEMLALSNNFAGTPVTKIEKDDGQISVLKGFTKDEFDKVFQLGNQPITPPIPPPIVAEPVAPPISEPTPPPVVEPTPPPITTPTTPPVEIPVAPPTPIETPKPSVEVIKDDKLASLLANLQAKANVGQVSPLIQPPPTPSIPNFQ